MEDDELYLLIKKYLEGQCTPEEKIRIEDWYEQQDTTPASFYQNDPEAIAASAKRSHAVIQQAISQEPLIVQFPQRRSVKQYTRWIAAACLLIAGCTALYFLKPKPSGLRYNEIVAAAGHVIHLKLSDGTLVSLNAGSHLKYPQAFGSGKRDIYLEGEGWFDVAHDTSRPFKVHTSGLTTTVLGTAFSVTAFKNAVSQSVIVMRGKVRVADDKHTLGLITPNQRIVYDLHSKKGTISTVESADLMSWKNGQLQFADQEMEDIAGRLARWYGYEFRLNNAEMGKCRYTASFNNKISMKDMLEILKAISHIDYKIDENTRIVTLYGDGCNH